MRAAFSVKDHSISNECFDLVDCERCGFRFTTPRPEASKIGSYYVGEAYLSHATTGKSFRERLYRLARKWSIGRKFALIHRLQPNGQALDIGCGTGEFLAHLMSRGYLVQGVEPSLTARERAIADHGLSVVPSLDQVTAYEKFQVITMWHVLEHIPDLRGVLKKLFALLADRGLLVIAVPDRQSWDASHYGPFWAAWDVPRHFNHFRREDIHALLGEHGFVRITTKRMWLDAFYIAMLSEQYKGASQTGAMIKGTFIGLWSNIISLVTSRPTSSSLYIARKVEP